MPKMGLLLLPNELVLSIASSLEYDWDISAFSQVNRCLRNLLTHELYVHNFRHFNGSALTWAAIHGKTSTMQKCLDEGALELASETDLRDTMLLAAKYGHTGILEQLLENGISQKRADEPFEIGLGYDTFFQAVKSGQESVVHVLLAHGVNAKFLKDGLPTMFCAAMNGNLSLMKLFVETLGFHPDFEGDFHCTSLQYAAYDGHLEVVQYLLEKGADPNVRMAKEPTEDMHDTMISKVAMLGNVEILQCLIEHGAEVNPTAPDGTALYPICVAIEYEHLEAANLLLSHMDTMTPPKTENDEAILLCIAAACGSETLVRQILDNGCLSDVTQEETSFPFQKRQSPLLWALEMGHENVASLLISKGAGMNGYPCPTYGLHTPLFWAAVHGNTNLVKTILDKGTDPNCMNLSNDSPLSLTARSFPTFKLLLEYGADPSIGGRSTFMVRDLLQNGKLEHLQVLVDLGIDLTTANFTDEESGFRISVTQYGSLGGVPTLEFLRKNGIELAPPDSMEGSIALENLVARPHLDLEAVEYLLKMGYRLPEDGAPLTIGDAAAKALQYPDAPDSDLDLLLRYGQDINVHREAQGTCMFSRMNRRETDSLRLLLDKGANPLYQDELGNTPLFFAAVLGFTEGVELLLRYVDTFPRDYLIDELRWAESGAIEQKQWHIVRILQRFYYRNLAGSSDGLTQSDE